MTELSSQAEVARRKAAVVNRQTDYQRWHDAGSYERFWSDRSTAAGRLCSPGQWVCDIGCGLQGLAKVLPPGCTYLPADLRHWNAAVEPCDLNAGLLPRRHLARCDIVTLLGVTEYIFDPPGLLAALARYAETIVMSYNPVDFADVDRAGFGWVNALTSQAVVDLLRHAGFRPNSVERHGTSEILVRASNPSFTRLRQLRRHVARIVYARPNTPAREST